MIRIALSIALGLACSQSLAEVIGDIRFGVRVGMELGKTSDRQFGIKIRPVGSHVRDYIGAVYIGPSGEILPKDPADTKTAKAIAEGIFPPGLFGRQEGGSLPNIYIQRIAVRGIDSGADTPLFTTDIKAYLTENTVFFPLEILPSSLEVSFDLNTGAKQSGTRLIDDKTRAKLLEPFSSAAITPTFYKRSDKPGLFLEAYQLLLTLVIEVSCKGNPGELVDSVSVMLSKRSMYAGDSDEVLAQTRFDRPLNRAALRYTVNLPASVPDERLDNPKKQRYALLKAQCRTRGDRLMETPIVKAPREGSL